MYERIRSLRKENKLTQKEVADYLHYSQRTYSNYERGDVKIPLKVLVMLAILYNTSVDYILNRRDIKEPYLKK